MGQLLLLGAGLGLGYGLAEGLIFSLFGLIPGALAWRNGNSAPVLLVAPAVYAVTYVAVAAMFAGLSRVKPRLEWDSALVCLLGAVSGFLGASLQGQVFSDTASLILGLGVGAVLFRTYRARRAWVLAHLSRMLAVVGLLTITVGLSAVGARAARERLAMRELPPPPREAVNVLLLVMDTQRADHLSLYGYLRPTSPRLVQFAREAIVYREAIAPSSWTLPSHAGIFTAQPVIRHRAGEVHRPYLGGEYPTLAEGLEGAGYATGGFVANTFWTGRQTRLNRGFVHYEDFYSSLGDALSRTVLGRRLAYDLLPRFGLVDIPGRKRAGEVNREFLAWQAGLGARPFFAFLNYMDVHGPYLPPAPFRGRFGPVPVDSRPRAIELGAVNDETRPPRPEVLKEWVDRYDESILYLDHEIGELLDRLRERGVLDRTLVIITSDHGESFGRHGLVYHGNSLFPAQIRVPLLIRLPGGARGGSELTGPASLTDIPATVAAVTGRAPGFPGTSLLDREARGVVVTEVGFRPQVPRGWPTAHGWLRSLVTPRWQLIHYQSGKVELYDRRADPFDFHNLAADSAYKPVVRRLEQQLSSRLTAPPAARP